MRRETSTGWFRAALIAGGMAVVSTAVLAGVPSSQQPGAGAPRDAPQRRIEAQNGDMVVVQNDARVTIVRARQGTVRWIFNPEQRWLVVLVDYAVPNGPDGRVDTSYTLNGVEGAWPLDDRWEGQAVVEDYSLAGEGGAFGVGIEGPRGLVQLLPPSPSAPFLRVDAALAVLTVRNLGRGGGGGGQPFDIAEQQQVATAMRNAEMQSRLPAAAGMSTSTALQATGAAGAPAGFGDGLAPVRVGGTVRQPLKLVDVPGALPDQAREAGVRGVVILELIIGTDGAVTSVRVLRSIPLLDAAAVAAAKQWRYEPTVLNGQAVPVILTATVNFQ